MMMKYMKMDNSIMDLWLELQRMNKLPKGSLSAVCEPELLELLKQIDQMMSTKRKELEQKKDDIQSRLTLREKECQMHKATLEQKHQEIGQLRQQLDNSENKQRDLVGQYESQLLQLKTELLNLKREYERLHKRHIKHKKEAEREKEKSMLELQDGVVEVRKLNNKVEEYKQKSKDWEYDRKNLQTKIENLEAQRNAISDKCEFVQHQFDQLEKHKHSLMDKCEIVQQQAQTYLLQLDKRREILESTEFSLNAQIAQLEAKLNSSTESLKIQISRVEKLKTSLDEATSSHRKAMDDNEKLLNEKKKCTAQVRKLEDMNAELQAELRAREGFLRMAEEDSKQHAHNIELLRKQISEKDDVIKSLSITKNKTEDEQISSLRKHLTASEDQAKLFKRNESNFVQEIHKLQEELNTKRDAIDNLNKKLDQKKTDVMRLEEEFAAVKSQLVQAQSRLSCVTDSHDAELQGMKDQLMKMTTGMCSNGSNVDSLIERTEELEKRLKSETDRTKKMDAELQVANAQIEALHLENRHLRQTIIKQTQLNLDHTEKESRLKENLGLAQSKVQDVEQENIILKSEINVLQQELSNMEEQHDSQFQRTVHESKLSYTGETPQERRPNRRLHEPEADSSRRISVSQDRRNMIQSKYEEYLGLRQQMEHLGDDPERERIAGSYFQNTELVFDEDDGVIYMNEDMSLSETDSINDLMGEMPSYSSPVKFLMEEQARTRQLEDIIDSRIEQMSSNTDMVIKKHQQ